MFTLGLTPFIIQTPSSNNQTSRPQEEQHYIRGKPCCPNHGEPLEGLPDPLTPKGTGKCPVSGCDFDYVIDLDDKKVERDKFGNIKFIHSANVTGND